VGRFPLQAGELLASSGARTEAVAAAEKLGVGALTGRPLPTRVNSLASADLGQLYSSRRS
jgi:hypothetical protein